MKEETKQLLIQASIAVIVTIIVFFLMFVIFSSVQEATRNQSGSIENSCSYPENWSWNRSITYEEMTSRHCVWNNNTFELQQNGGKS